MFMAGFIAQCAPAEAIYDLSVVGWKYFFFGTLFCDGVGCVPAGYGMLFLVIVFSSFYDIYGSTGGLGRFGLAILNSGVGAPYHLMRGFR